MMKSITSTNYYDECMSIATGIVEEFKEYGGDLHDHAHEQVEGHQWIIYYAYNDDLLKHASDPDAWEQVYRNEEIGYLVTTEGMTGARSVQAYWAMLEDVNSALHELEAFDL